MRDIRDRRTRRPRTGSRCGWDRSGRYVAGLRVGLLCAGEGSGGLGMPVLQPAQQPLGEPGLRQRSPVGGDAWVFAGPVESVVAAVGPFIEPTSTSGHDHPTPQCGASQGGLLPV